MVEGECCVGSVAMIVRKANVLVYVAVWWSVLLKQSPQWASRLPHNQPMLLSRHGSQVFARVRAQRGRNAACSFDTNPRTLESSVTRPVSQLPSTKTCTMWVAPSRCRRPRRSYYLIGQPSHGRHRINTPPQGARPHPATTCNIIHHT